MDFENIRYEATDGIARITLNRPECLNAINLPMHGELRNALDAVEADKGLRVLLLTGSGRGFCAGQDLTERSTSDGQLPRDIGKSLDSTYHPLIRRLRALEIPILCAVNGVAAGAGASLVMACDVVIAARSASFIQAFSRIGLAPDSGSTYFLPRLVGEARARALALTGEAVDAETAERWGLIWQCVPDNELEQRTNELAHKLSKQPPLAMAEIKKLLQHSLQYSLDEELDRERDALQRLGWTEDYLEGVQAFLEKRPARFRGR